MSKKKFFLLCIFVMPFFHAVAQDEEEEKKGGLKKENMFVGGSLTLSFSSYFTVIGLSPYFGYSVNKYLDVAASVNWNYSSQRDVYIPGDKIKMNIYGPGAFVRIFPLNFLFAQAQYEYNFINVKYVPAPNNVFPQEKESLRASSLLLGGGYSNGRQGGNMFYYFSILWDVTKENNSPYIDYLGRSFPIFRAGINIKLFPGGSNN